MLRFSTLAFVYLSYLFQAVAVAQSSTYQKGEAYDCTGVEIEEVDPSTLTIEEQIALLDEALLDSVDRYSNCINAVQSKMAASSGGGGGSGGGNGSGGAGEGSASQEGSEQDGSEQGNAEEGTEETESLEEMNESSEISSPNSGTSSSAKSTKGTTGAKDKLIPPKDNDNIVCALLWDEISSSTDAAEKQGLIEEYEDLQCGK